MHKYILGLAAVACATGFAIAAETRYVPHHVAGAAPVAYQTPESESVCSKDAEILACVVQLGPAQSDRWAYSLNDASGAPNSDVKFRQASPGAACAAMAYPVGNVALAGGTGEWFNGKIENACRQ